MAREIVQEDIVRVRALTKKVLGTEEYTEFARMGGLTNHTYRIRLKDGAEYVVRIPGLGTEELINRKDEMVSTKQGRRVDGPVLHCRGKGFWGVSLRIIRRVRR